MYRVLARTWRPQTFDELVGQSHVARTLANAIKADRLAHAYLFAGVRGTGKTTVARILAKCVNCEKGPTITPCGECAPCREIAEGRAIDVLEIDAASRTKVEQTRELLELVSYAPARDRYKVLIIDEAHMLSKASFNALLKTLEEPPPRVLFVLATTEIHKILATILSRCQVFEFRRISASEVASHLRRIVDAEKVSISDAALERIARAGEGSVRDSLSVLERVLAFSGTEVADDDVLRMLGAVHTDVLVGFFRALAARDAGGMLAVLDGLIDEGHDLLHFWGELVGALRDLLLLDALPDRRDLLARSADEVEALACSSNGLSRDDLTRAFQVLADLEPALRASSQSRYLFEAALIRLATLGAVRPIEELLARLGGEAPASAPRPPAPTRTVTAPAPAPSRRPATRTEPAAPPAVPRPAPAGPLGARLVETIDEARPGVAAILRQATSIAIDGDLLRVILPVGALKRQLDRDAPFLRDQASDLAGRPVRVEILVQGAAAASPATGASTPQTGATPADRRGPALLDEARAEPGVRRLLDAFGAQVVDIHPLEAAAAPPPDGDDN